MLLVSPFVLFLIGLIVARLAKARRVWRRNSLFTANVALVVLVLYTVLSLGLLFDMPALVRWTARLGIEEGTPFFIGSGFVDVAATWPIHDMRLMALVIVSFMLYPFWLWLGIQGGFWLFGRSPKQTGILGLLR